MGASINRNIWPAFRKARWHRLIRPASPVAMTCGESSTSRLRVLTCRSSRLYGADRPASTALYLVRTTSL